MVAAALGFSNVQLTGFPPVRTFNCLSEKSPTLPNTPESLIARWGLKNFVTLSDGPAEAMFHKRGLFSDAALIIGAGKAFTLTTGGTETQISGDTIEGDSYPDVDAGLDPDYVSTARVATGTGLYKITPDTIESEDFPTAGGAGAVSVAFYKGYWVALEAGTDAFYYQNPGETDWNALQFASTEYQPDPGVVVRQVGDLLVFLNTNSGEVWRATGDSGDPLAPYGGLVFDHGCRARATAVNCQGSLLYVDNNCSVRMFTGGEPEIVSAADLVAEIADAGAADLRASFVIKNQHPLYVLHIVGQATWVLDLSNRRWVRYSSQGFDYWRANLLVNVRDDVFASDLASHKIWKLDPDRLQDETDTFTMEWTAILPAGSSPIPLANVQLICETGGGPLSGQGSDPLVWLQVSRDGGKSWGPKKYRSLGVTGDDVRVRWNALGLSKPNHDVLFLFGCSEPVIRRVSGVLVNET